MAINYQNLAGGGAQLTTEAPGVAAPGVGGGPDMGGFFMSMARRRMAQEDADRAAAAADRTRRNRMENFQFGRMQRDSRMRGNQASERSVSPLQNMRESAEMSSLQAKMNPAPQRLISGPGIVPGMGMDVNRMNAFQKEAHLPGGSQFEQGGMSGQESARNFRESRGIKDVYDPLAHGRQRE